MKTDEEKLKKLEQIMSAIAWQVVGASKGDTKVHDTGLEDRRKYHKEFLAILEAE